MTAIEAQLMERLKKLPANRVAELADFVDFLASREERAAAAHRLTQSLAKLDALDLPPITEDEVKMGMAGLDQQYAKLPEEQRSLPYYPFLIRKSRQSLKRSLFTRFYTKVF